MSRTGARREAGKIEAAGGSCLVSGWHGPATIGTTRVAERRTQGISKGEAKQLGKFEKYLIEEFYDDYRQGEISRRTFIRRVAFITGSMGAAIAAMAAVGCQPIELPAETEPMPEPETPTPVAEGEAQTGAVPGAQSPLSVPEGDPDVQSSTVAITSQGDEISGYLARPAAEGAYPAVLVCHENRGLTPTSRT
jgi:carboxymethylenebutenolidase